MAVPRTLSVEQVVPSSLGSAHLDLLPESEVLPERLELLKRALRARVREVPAQPARRGHKHDLLVLIVAPAGFCLSLASQRAARRRARTPDNRAAAQRHSDVWVREA